MSEALTVACIADAVLRIHAQVDAMRDELNAADRALGDGDTGMTVANVVSAWITAVQTPADDVGAMLQRLGRETRRATGSSLGSVMAIGLTAAGKAAGASPVDRRMIVAMLGNAADAIVERSGACAGDKTILDSVLAVRDAMAEEKSALEAASQALDDFRSREARVGRARMYGARSAGHDDPGMLAALLLLRAANEHHVAP
ncbi:MAG TPA: DAK2 domain-containing protein [Casimicrobiaceae bacterium]